jgi:hypothetical protein
MQRSVARPAGPDLSRPGWSARDFQVEVAGHVEAEQAALLLPVDHGDDARAVQLLDGPDRLGSLDGEPAARQQRLQGQHRKDDPDQGGESNDIAAWYPMVVENS